MAAIGAAVDTSAQAREAEAARERPNRHGAEEVQALKARNNFTNWKHLARIYLVIAAAIDRRRLGDRGGARRRTFLVVGGARDARRHHRHRRLAASVRRRHPRRHPLHAVRQPQAQRAGVRLAGGVSHSDDDLPLPPASPGAPPVRQRSRARSRYQPVARKRPLARLSDHACRDPVVAAEAAVGPQPLPLHDHPRPLQLHSGEAQSLFRSRAARHHPAAACRRSLRRRRSADRHPAHGDGLRDWRWRSSCR